MRETPQAHQDILIEVAIDDDDTTETMQKKKGNSLPPSLAGSVPMLFCYEGEVWYSFLSLHSLNTQMTSVKEKEEGREKWVVDFDEFDD